ILEIASLSAQPNEKAPPIEGNSLSPHFQTRWQKAKEQESYGETFYGFQNFNWKIQRSLRTPEKKLIEGFKETAIGFDLKKDPKETTPYLADDELTSYVALLKKYVDSESSTGKTLENTDQKYSGPYWSMPPAKPSEFQKNPGIELTILLKEMNQALNLAEAEKYEEALISCESLLNRDPKNIAIWNLKAKLLSSDQVKRYREGAEVFEQLMQLRPELTKLCLHGIIHNYIRLNKFESAKKQIARLEELEKQGDLKRDYQTYNFLAFLQIEEGEPEKALKTLELSYEDHPHKNPICDYYRSQAYFRLGRLKEGSEALKRCLKENEKFTPGFETKEAYIRELLKKGIEAISEKQFLDAEIFFQQSVGLGEVIHSRYYLALIFMNTGRKPAATALFTEILKKFPEYHDAYFYLAYLLLEASRLEEGTRAMEEAVNCLEQCYEDHREEMKLLLKQLQEILPKHTLCTEWKTLLKRISQ
ncbi:MAG: tetratricopeptide repeat protein, partial [Planctomycetota bacterium]